MPTLCTYPGETWERCPPESVAMDPAKLKLASRWYEEHSAQRPYRAVVVRHGRLVAEWHRGVAPRERMRLASAAKSFYSCMLGIAVADGVIGSADDPAIRYFPRMVDVPDGLGPKPGRFARPKDRGITLRHLISNTSGYLKPGEEPGRVYHYQTYGMNVLCHCIASAYGVYDPEDPERLPGFGSVMQEKLRDPIGAGWTWSHTNFRQPPGARVGTFGNYTQISASPLDCARAGLLWMNAGRWAGRQVVPQEWMRQATRLPDWERTPAPGEEGRVGRYGLGFWLNVEGRSWSALPHDSFAASGAGGHAVWVCPGLGLVVVISPGLYSKGWDQDAGFLERVCAACVGTG